MRGEQSNQSSSAPSSRWLASPLQRKWAGAARAKIASQPVMSDARPPTTVSHAIDVNRQQFYAWTVRTRSSSQLG